MRQSNHIDLRNAAGDREIDLTGAGQSAVFQFNAQQSRIGAGGSGRGMYNYIRGIAIQAEINLTQPADGGLITYDQILGAIGAINLNTPLFGTLIDPNVVQNGILAKHLLEYFCGPRLTAGLNRPIVPAAAATYDVFAELYLPFSQNGWNEWGDQFAMWLGWLDTAQLEIFFNSSADPFAQLQTEDGVTPATLNSVKLRASLDMVPFGKVVIPPVVALRKYYQPASAGSNGPTLIGVGNNGALQGTDDMSRLLMMAFAHNAGGFTGSGTADEISTLTLPWRDQAQTLNIYALFQRFLADRHDQQYGGTAVSASAPIAQQFDYPEPYGLIAGPVTDAQPLNNAKARYTPLVWPQKFQMISHLQRVKGNYPLDMTFSADQASQFNIYTLEIKQWSAGKAAEMLAAMNINPQTVSLVPLFGDKNVRFGKTQTGTPVVTGQVSAKKTFCLPRGIVLNTAAASATAG